MAKRKRYTDEYRSNAVVLLAAAGYPDKPGALAQVAKQMDMHERTLSRWFNNEQNAPPDELVTEKKSDLATLLRDEIDGILGEMGKKRGSAQYRELATALGITVDKLQLLTGNPTSNDKQKLSIEYVNNWRDS